MFIQKTLGSGDVVYTYDGATAQNLVGRLAQVTDASGSMAFQYDVMGQISRSDRTISGVVYTTVSWFDLLGRLSTIQYPDHTTGAPSLVNYDYTGPFLNRVYDATSGYNFAQYNNYNALGQPVSTAYGNGVNTYFTYETNTFRLKSLQTTKSSTTLQNLEYAYDNVGNVSSITDYLTSANSQTFTYDELNRLLTGNSTAYGTLTYTYNAIGNMLSNSQVGTYTYPASGSSSVRPHAVTTAGSNSYTYDANGNMLTGAGRTFNSYDAENHPTSITSGGQTTTFIYDGNGGRVKKTTGSSVVWYISKLYECDATTCQKYIWSGDRRLAVKQVSNGQLHFYHGDHLGSTNVVTDSSGGEVQRVNYTPFGEVVGTVPTIAYKYTGKERDSATGLYWYEWRSYDPLLARFTTPDTIVPNPRDPQELNRYAYVTNNPLKYADPTGHFKIGKIFKNPIVRALGWALAPGLTQYLDPATRGPAIIGGAAAVGFVIGGPIGSKLAGESAAGLAFWGALGGAVSGGISGAYQGGLSGAAAGAFSGAMFGAIGGAYQQNWDMGRVALNSVAGGLSSQVKGNGFLSGFASSLAVSALTYANYEMRVAEIALSQKNPQNLGAESSGFFGDATKLAENRLVEDASGSLIQEQPVSLLGGIQGGKGNFLGIPYAGGGVFDYVSEAFAGPHDWLNHHLAGWYNPSTGNGYDLQGLSKIYGEAMNVINIPLATPLAGAAMIPNFAYHHLIR